MSLTSKEAAETLSDVERATRRSARAFGYRKASPHLILWGLIWLVGYSATDLRPEAAGTIWTVLTVVGIAASFYLGYRDRPANAQGPAKSWRALGLVAVLFVFIGGTAAIFGVGNGAQMGAFIPLLVGTVYAAQGLWLGPRFLLTGFAIIAITLAGYFLLREHFLLLMAFVGGGGLMLAGVWLRTA